MSNAARSLHDWPLAIAQVTPYPWEAQRDVNEYVERISLELARRGHRMLVLTPSGSRGLVRDSRRLIRATASDPFASGYGSVKSGEAEDGDAM